MGTCSSFYITLLVPKFIKLVYKRINERLKLQTAPIHLELIILLPIFTATLLTQRTFYLLEHFPALFVSSCSFCFFNIFYLMLSIIQTSLHFKAIRHEIFASVLKNSVNFSLKPKTVIQLYY